MSDRNHLPTARAKPTATGDEEAGKEIRLGEFDDVDTLTLSEALLVINMMKEKRSKKDGRFESEMMVKTLDYLDMFARFKSKAHVEAVENELDQYKGILNKFERAQLGSLVPNTADEATVLIPSLEDKMDTNTLNELCYSISAYTESEQQAPQQQE